MDFIQNGTGAVVRDLEAKVRERVSIEDFAPAGLAWDDDWTAVFAAAAASVGPGGVVHANGRYTLFTSPIIPMGVTVQGPYLSSPDQVPYALGGDFDGMNGVIFVRASTTGIVCRGFGGWRGLIIMREGLNLPFANATEAAAGVAAFEGKAFTNQGAGTTLENLLILGFDYAVYSDHKERLRCKGIRGDCTNGIRIEEAYDIPEVEDCHFWPYCTVHRSWTTPELLRRSGTAYFGQTVNDWIRYVRCFSYGYFRGFHARHTNDATFFLCGADNTSEHPGSMGFVIDGNCNRPRWIACQAAGQEIGFRYSNTSSTYGTMLSCDAWGCETNLSKTSGNLRITDGVGD